MLHRLSPILKVRLRREEKVKEIDQEGVGQVIFRNPEGSNEKMTIGYGVAGVSIVHPYSLPSLSEHVRITPPNTPLPPYTHNS